MSIFLKSMLKRNNLLVIILFFLTFIKLDSVSANETFLAYIKIDNTQINNISENGLETLRNLLITRTSINPKGLFRVAYARLKTRKEAADLISKIKTSGQDAWLLIEN